MAPARKDGEMDEGMKILLDEILTEQRACRSDIAKINAQLSEKKGERRIALALVAAVSGVVSFFVSFLK